MPNHCENDLYVRGTEERVNEVLRFIGAADADPDFDFAKVIPSRYADSHNWCVEHWGTRSSAYSVSVERLNPEEAVVHFETAWSPPKPIFYALAKKFPQVCLSLEYFECGMEFCGGIRRDAPEDVADNSPVEWEGVYKGMRGG